MRCCFSAFSAQTYVGRKRAAVDRICVGVPAGEVKWLSSLHWGLCRFRVTGVSERTWAVVICTWVPLKRCVFLSTPCPHMESLIVFCPVSASVCWELTELERRRPSKCWLATLMSPLGKPLWRVTGACQSKMSLVDGTVQGWIRCHLVYSAQMGGRSGLQSPIQHLAKCETWSQSTPIFMTTFEQTC